MEWEKKARNLKQPVVNVRFSLTFSIGKVDGLTASAAGVGLWQPVGRRQVLGCGSGGTDTLCTITSKQLPVAIMIRGSAKNATGAVRPGSQARAIRDVAPSGQALGAELEIAAEGPTDCA